MNDTIAAIATPPGRGGVGIIRISGPKSGEICQNVVGCIPAPRSAHYSAFRNSAGEKIDEGLAIFFKNPNSFTGEDILEIQAHGGPVILDMLLRRVLSLGARVARAGEFSERAFLNNKIDLVQAEAISQLISASTEQAAMAAMRSLQGEFSKRINDLVENLISLRLYVEAAIDFPEEEINFLADAHVQKSLQKLLLELDNISKQVKQGVLLEEGAQVVIAGKPNAGKSTLLNKLTGEDTAIVTPIAGTTRDIVKASINLDGVVLNVLDTAGLRDTDDVVEQAGIARTKQALELADLILYIIDSHDPEPLPELNSKFLIVYNKIDGLGGSPSVTRHQDHIAVNISAYTGAGLDLLRQEIKKILGVAANAADGSLFLARRRHLDSLLRAKEYIRAGKQQLEKNRAGELLAEELKHAQQELAEITGAFSSDDLLGRIFSEFCIGK